MQRGKAETDSEGRWLGNNRFELQDSQQLVVSPLLLVLAAVAGVPTVATASRVDITHTE